MSRLLDRADRHHDGANPFARLSLARARNNSRNSQGLALKDTRVDLIDRVFQKTRDAGFQEEKYRGLYLSLEWSDAQLIQMLDSRVNKLVRSRYSPSEVVRLKDLTPEKIDGIPTSEWIVSRTLMRSRDAIALFNEAIKQAADSPRITATMLKNAEGTFSRERLRSLADEWYADYANLLQFADLLKNRKAAFPLSELTEAQLFDFCAAIFDRGLTHVDDLSIAARNYVDTVWTFETCKRAIVEVFYRVGLLGIKLQPWENVSWSMGGRRSVSTAEIHPSARVEVHPCFHRALGIKPA